MADFKTHVTFSSVLGCGYAFAGMTCGVSTSTSLVAGGLCGLAGMLPDVDSDSGIPRRETMGFAAAIVPMMLVGRLQELDITYDQMILLAAGIYFGIRFVASWLIGRFSVHRGMWHSIPAALIFAGLTFLITRTVELELRYFKAFAVFLGVISHLVLDEVYSVDTRGVIPKFKRSFGTALKFWGDDVWANFSTYAKLAVVALAIASEPAVMERLEQGNPRLAGHVQSMTDGVRSFGDRVREDVGAQWDATPPGDGAGAFRPNSGGYREAPAAPGWGGYAPRGEPAPPEQDRTIYDTARRLFGGGDEQP